MMCRLSIIEGVLSRRRWMSMMRRSSCLPTERKMAETLYLNDVEANLASLEFEYPLHSFSAFIGLLRGAISTIQKD